MSKAAERPYSNIVTTGLDFSALNQFAFVNDKLVPNAVNPSQCRDPDLFLQSLEHMADSREIFKDNATSLSLSKTGQKSVVTDKLKMDLTLQNETGKLNIHHADRGIKDLLSTKEAYFKYLTERYQFRLETTI